MGGPHERRVAGGTGIHLGGHGGRRTRHAHAHHHVVLDTGRDAHCPLLHGGSQGALLCTPSLNSYTHHQSSELPWHCCGHWQEGISCNMRWSRYKFWSCATVLWYPANQLLNATWIRNVQVVFRATRTWLPDPQYWFVPPRTRDYDSGGWYIEWVGHEQASRAGWLHPGVACMILAMQALKVERGQGPWWLRRTRHEQITAR